MGGLGSKMELVDVDDIGTPTKCHLAHRQLDIDPRSPTNNIVRTPIMVDKTPSSDIDPRSPTPGIWRTPITSTSDIYDDARVERLVASEEVASPVRLQEDDDLLKELGEESAELQQLSLSDVDESCTLLMTKDKVPKKSKMQKAHPKKLFYEKKSKSVASNPKYVLNTLGVNLPRSPLSTVVIDTNSPRVIVQRKQTKKIDAARLCRLDAISSQNKENVDM